MGLIFKYGVLCRFYEIFIVNVFVCNLIDDVIVIKKNGFVVLYIMNWLEISLLRICYVNIIWIEGF